MLDINVTHTSPGACLSIKGVIACTHHQPQLPYFTYKISYLWGDIFRSEPSPSAAKNQIDWFCTVRPLPDSLLNRKHIIWHDLGLCDFPLVVSEIAEDFFQSWYAFVS